MIKPEALSLTIALLLLVNVFCQNKSSLLKIPYYSGNISIDGRIDDWRSCFKTTFQDTLTTLHGYPGHPMMAFYDGSYNYAITWNPVSRNQAEVMVCWDLNNLYVAVAVTDQHLYAQMPPGGKYSQLHLNDAVELYLDSKNDSDSMMDINDYQFLIDCKGQNIVFRGDLNMILSDTLTAPKESGQNIYFEYAVSADGTLNDTVTDRGFVVEMAIPFTAIGLKPLPGLQLRIDVCINDNDYDLNGVTTYEEKALRYWPFNWSGYSDFGYPETWKVAVLTGEPGWLDKLTGAGLKRWLAVYLSFLIFTIALVVILLLRMVRMKRLPAHSEIQPSKVVFLEKQQTGTPKLSPNQQILKKASEILTCNHQENYGSERLANEIGISIRTFQRVTKEELNLTPTNFIYLVKLNLAADYLKNHLGNVSETAYEFGFSDPGYFSKLFKKHFGMTPLEFQEKNDNNR